MKKMIVSLVAVTVMAVSAHAIQLNWGVTAVMNNGAGVALAGKAVALVMAASTATTAAQITFNWDGTTATVGGGQLVGSGFLDGTGKFTGAAALLVGVGGAGAWGTDIYTGANAVKLEGGATAVTSQGTGSANATRYYMIVFDNTYSSGNYAIASPGANTTVAGPTSPGTTAFTVGTGAGSTWIAVPEPTSMALLALGVAAIGLRRKFRK